MNEAGAPGAAELPSLRESAAYIASLGKPTAAEVLDRMRARGRVAVQPRCGVGEHEEMLRLLRALEAEAAPDILTLTIDSHTRLRRFRQAMRVLNLNPRNLNGYPLVTHGWQRGRQLNEAIAVPLEIRHGSPEPEQLFAVSVATGITSFEGGGISYNLPYSKDVPLARSLAAWNTVDRACGELAELGTVIDRELFGTLTAVLVPPSTSLAISVLEAVLAVRAGVRCVSIAYPQGGHLVQDVAALRAIPVLAERYLPAGVTAHAVLHEFMGVFPPDRDEAEDLIFYGALVARLGGATKLITKTWQEAAADQLDAVCAEIRRLRDSGHPLIGAYDIDRFMIEEFIEGPLYSAESFSFDGQHVVMAITEAITDQHNQVHVGHAIPGRMTAEAEVQVVGAVRDFLDAMEYRDGPAHTEFKLSQRGMVVIESQNRVGGALLATMIRSVYGADPQALAVTWALRQVPALAGRPVGQGAAASWLIVAGPGRISGIQGLAEIRGMPSTLDVDLWAGPGDIVRSFDGQWDGLGHVASCAGNTDDAIRVCRETLGRLHIVTETEPRGRAAA